MKLYKGHKGDIYLYHGSRDESGLYWVEEMQQLEKDHANFHYKSCISQGAPSSSMVAGRANDVAFKDLPDLKGYRIFLCGHPDMVSSSKRQAYLNGASLADIYADAFHVVSHSLD